MPVERFKAEVDADIQRFKRKMAEVDRQMHELATGVSVEINASINEFMQKVQQVQAQLQKLDATEVTVEIEAMLNDFMRDLLQVRALAQDLDGESIKIKVLLDMDVFYTQILMVQAELAALSNQSPEVDVDLNMHSGGALTDLATVEALLAALRDATVDIRADISNFLAGTAIVNQQANKLDRRNIIIKIWADYTNAMESYATTVRAFAEAGQQMIGGALLSLVPVLSQFLSVLVGLIGSLGVMIGVLAGQLLIMASALGIAALGIVGLAAVAIPTIKNLFDETAQLTAEQQRAKASWDSFKDTYDDLVKATEQPVLQAFTSAMQGAQKILQSLSPMIESVANSTAKLMQAFDQSINTQPIQKIFDTFNKYGASIFENIVAGIGNFVAAIGSLIAALAPAAEIWSINFNSMMQSFASWADGLSESENFKTFIDYVQTYMPIISDIFADVTMGLIAFFSAFADMGGSFMTSLAGMMERFRAWAESLGENQQFQQFLSFIQKSTPAVLTLLGNLWDLIINLGIAFAPVGAVVLDLANSFLEWFNRMLEGQGIFSDFIGILPVAVGLISAIVPIVISVVSVFGNLLSRLPALIKAFSSVKTMLSVVWSVLKLGPGAFGAIQAALAAVVSPIAIVIAAIVAFIAFLVTLYQTNETFRNQVQTVWEAIKTGISTAITGIKNSVMSIWTQITSFWNENQESIKATASTIWNVIGNVVTTVMSAIGAIMQFIWPVVKALIVSTWDAIMNVIKGAIDVILGVIKTFSSLFQGDWKGVWDGIKQILSGAVQAIWGIVNLYFVGKLLGPLKAFGSTAKTFLQGIWTAIKGIFTNTLNAIKNTVSTIFNSIKSTIETVWTGIKTFFNTILTGIKSIFMSIWRGIASFLDNLFSSISGLVRSVWNGIKNVMSNVLNAIANVVKSIWNGIKNTITSILNGIKSTIETIWNGFKNIVSTAMDNVKTAVIDGWNKAKSFLENISLIKIGEQIVAGLITGINNWFGKVKAKVMELAELLPEWLRKKLGIHSPSRVMAAIAKWIPAGVAKGITDNINVAKSAAQEMANAIVPDFSKTVKATEGLLKQINEVSKKYAKENTATRYDEFEKLLGEQSKWYNLSASYEKAYWQDVAKHLKDGTAAKRKALENVQSAQAQILKEQYDREIKFIDEATKYNALSLTDRIQAYEQYMKQYALGSEQQVAYEEKIYDAKKELYDRMKSLSDDYLSKVQTVYDNLANEEKRLRDEWQQTYDARIDTLKNTWSLFDKVSLTDMSEVDLLGNLRGQVDTMRGWMNDLFELEARGVDSALIGELQQMGAKSAAEIAALTRMTASELNEYQMLWQTKTELAKKQATKELESARLTMEEEVKKLNTNAETELKKLQKSFESEVKKLRYGAEGEFNLMSASLPKIGVQAIQGLINGLTSMKGKLQSSAKSMANSLKNTLQTELDIHSPSRWADRFIGVNFAQGAIDGISRMQSATESAGASLASWLQNGSLQTAFSGNSFTSDTSQYINQDLIQDIDYEQQPINVNIHQEWNGEEVEYWLDDRSATNLQLKTFKKG